MDNDTTVELGIVSNDYLTTTNLNNHRTYEVSGYGNNGSSSKQLGLSDFGIMATEKIYKDDGSLSSISTGDVPLAIIYRSVVTNNDNIEKSLSGYELDSFVDNNLHGKLDPYVIDFEKNTSSFKYTIKHYDTQTNEYVDKTYSINQTTYAQDVLSELKSLYRNLVKGNNVHKDSKIDFNLKNNSIVSDSNINTRLSVFLNSGKLINWDVVNGAYSNYCDMTYLKSKIKMASTALITVQVEYTLDEEDTVYIVQDNNWIIAHVNKISELTWENSVKDYEDSNGNKIISIEFINGKLRAIPLTKRIDECIISKCIINIIQ